MAHITALWAFRTDWHFRKLSSAHKPSIPGWCPYNFFRTSGDIINVWDRVIENLMSVTGLAQTSTRAYMKTCFYCLLSYTALKKCLISAARVFANPGPSRSSSKRVKRSRSATPRAPASHRPPRGTTRQAYPPAAQGAGLGWEQKFSLVLYSLVLYSLVV